MAQRRQRFPEHERNQLVDLAMQTLWSNEGESALTYLREKRGLSDEVIRDFRMGFCPMRVDHELRGRIITPIFDAYGKVVALSTRHHYREKDFWHESFDKPFFLYGLHLAKKMIIQTQKAVVVEGEFDVAALHGANIKNAVGVCGSAFTVFHANLLARYCSETYLVFDSDKGKYVKGKFIQGSGQRAADRAIETKKSLIPSYLASVGVRYMPVYLPTGLDPDDFVRERGPLALIDLMRKAKNDADLIMRHD